MEEIWKDIAGYEGYYQVSNLGRVKSLTRYVPTSREGWSRNKYVGRIMSPKINKHGYKCVVLMKDCKHKYTTIHRLVATAFVYNDDIEHKTQINHKDEDKLNNCASNLEWCDAKYNCNYGSRNERMGKNVSISLRNNKSTVGDKNPMFGRRGGLSPHAKKVYQYDKDLNLIKIWPSFRDLIDSGYCNSELWRAITGRKKFYKDCVWSYTELKKEHQNG